MRGGSVLDTAANDLAFHIDAYRQRVVRNELAARATADL
jgi:hypothetical protein